MCWRLPHTNATPIASHKGYSTTSYLQSRQVKQQSCQQTSKPCGGVSPGRRRLRGAIATTPHRSSLPGSYLWRDMEIGAQMRRKVWRDLIRKGATRIPWLRLATEELWLSIILAKANKMDITCFPDIWITAVAERCSTSYRHPHRPASVPQTIARHSGISEVRRDISRSDAIE